MDEQQATLLSRIGKWFRRGGDNGDLPLMLQTPASTDGSSDPSAAPSSQMVTRSTFLRPWAKRDQAIANLQEGFGALTDLMRTIRDSLDDQNRRQEQLLQTISRLPEALESLPESNRVQNETLRAIHQQIEAQGLQQDKLAQILSRICEADADQRRTVDALREQVDTINEHERAISGNLSSMGAAMQSVSRNSQTSAEVLGQLRDNMGQRDTELERVLHTQGTRFTTLLAVAIFLSVVALAAVAVVGYLGYEAVSRIHP
jgi:lambda repressor-like predicted transcriptional regulator